MSRSDRKTDPTAREIAELVAFLPKLSAPGFQPIVDWGGGQDEAGAFTLPWPRYAEEVQDFRRLASSECWTDYEYDPVEAGRMLMDQDAVRRADVKQIKTMLTCCIRGERFCDGHLGAMIEEGHVQRLLTRLEEIA